MSLNKLQEKVKDREALYIRDKVEINAPLPPPPRQPKGFVVRIWKESKRNQSRIRKPSMCYKSLKNI